MTTSSDQLTEAEERMQYCMLKLDSGLSRAAVVHLCCRTFSCSRASGYRSVGQAEKELAASRSAETELQNSGKEPETIDIERMLMHNIIDASDDGDAKAIMSLVSSLEKVKKWRASSLAEAQQQADKMRFQ